MTERSLLAALIAGLILPPTATAQDSSGFSWQCQQNAQGGWQCSSAAPGDTPAPSPTPTPAPATAPTPPTAPVPAAPAPVRATPATPTTPAEPPVTTATPPAAAVQPEATAQPPAQSPVQAHEITATPPTPPPAPSVVTSVPEPAPAQKTPTEPQAVARAEPQPVTPEDRYDPWALCAVPATVELPAAELTDTALTADQAATEPGPVYVLTGNAVIERAGSRVQADSIRYNEAKQQVHAKGNVRLDESDLRVTGSEATLQLATDQGDISDVRYAVPSRHARGEALSAHQENKVLRSFDQATYSTCDEGHEAWRLSARDVTLKHDEGFGTARNVWLELADVPVLYTPYISFPIDNRRKSGLLIPRIGHTQNTGTELALPYYWNIAPNRDATITPRLMSERGVQMQGEFRYLNPTNSGELGLEYLPSDSDYNDEDRSLVRIDHTGRPLPRLRTDVFGSQVSDDQYFEDLGTSLEVSSTTHLERRAQAAYNGEGWDLTGRVQDFQTIDSTIPDRNQPYRRLPQVLFSANPRTQPYGLNLTLDSEAVQFDHDERLTGTRLDLLPKVSLPLGGAAWYVTPAVGGRYTQYNLDDANTHGFTDSPDRSTPIASIDSGLLFDRNVSLFGTGLMQTLEPRAFYLNVPYDEQSDLPVFDTGLTDFSFPQLFEDNRFNGADRMGDANQLTLAATSRLLDPVTGTQHMSFSLGEILYFRDRKVTLPGQPAEEQSSSNLVSELELRLSQTWKTSAGLQWDPNETKTELGTVRLQYQPDYRHLLNFAYRYRSGDLEQVDTSALWHFTPRWHGIMRWNYSLPDNELLEGLGGVEYESCCWIVRVLGRSYIGNTDIDPQAERNDAILLQLELKGLTSLGDPIESVLENGILGYPRN
ncbi:MAG: LPS assembly protein LptD [Gammaproteobacteria bacterium]|nr:LPS assembly protein LptD [Gammaproteobacteria bacterium]